VGGAGAGDAGGAASGVPAQGGLGSPGDVVAGENNLFPGVPAGLEWLEVMPLANAPRLENGTRRLYIREGFARGVAMDRLTLASVDHAPGADAVPVPGGTIYVGQRRAAVRVVDALGRDLTSQALGIGLGPVHADSGATLFVTLAPQLDGFEDVLVVESAWGSSERTGISVDGLTGSGTWRPVGSIHPRRGWSEQGLLLRGATELRLRLHDAVAIRFIGRLGTAVMANTSGAAPVFARTADGTDWTQAVMTSDGRDGVVVPGDTLQLAFTNLPAPAGSERSWFLVVDGAPLTPADAYQRAQLGRLDAPGPVPVAFALHQNVPNPFAHATEFRFDLPRAADVELSIFDMQGRIVRRFASHEDAGRRAYRWDLRDADGHPVAPGVYAYRMRAGTFTAERKLVVTR
jgi:hypothetical protein